MKTQEINLQAQNVVIDHHTKRECEVCGKEIFLAVIKIEPLGLNIWGAHKCK